MNDGVVMVSNLSKSFQHILVEIKLSDRESYNEKLPEYKNISDKLDNYIKNARIKLRDNSENEKKRTRRVEKQRKVKTN